MRVVHESGRVLASEVETADSFLSQARGLMFRRSIPDDYALVFRFDDQGPRDLHMVFVPFAIDACWLCDGVVQQVSRLRAWRGYGKHVADTVVEAPAGTFDDVEAGDRLRFE
ncbi:DUF192 domain-containing protein [Halomarina salina]|uniref:DUF192 domain-containing protein n=1 Tax=Halomarina salina TaxID=1872699 RepID=A0ABD5RK65_9EURY|nr:DUF192 domain-containing protein [Halomarina salina]